MLKWIETRLLNSARANRVYILPTFLGLKIFFVNFILLILGLIYANNYLLLFNFIFFCLFLMTMFYTHFNLLGFVAYDLKVEPGFANSNSNVTLYYKNENLDDRFSLNVSMKSNNFIYKLNSFNPNPKIGTHRFDIQLNQRGVETFKRIKIETNFPLNLFVCFSYFDINFEIITFPALSMFTDFISNKSFQHSEEIGDFALNEYRPGDKINSILWKKSTLLKTYIKKEIAPEENTFIFDLNHFLKANNDTEKILSELTSAINYCFENKIYFALLVEDKNITGIDNSLEHRNKCLKILAEYEP